MGQVDAVNTYFASLRMNHASYGNLPLYMQKLSRKGTFLQEIAFGIFCLDANDYIMRSSTTDMYSEKISLFLTTLLVLSVLVIAPATAGGGGGGNSEEVEMENADIMLMSTDGVEILDDQFYTFFAQGTTLELEWEFVNLDNETDYTFHWFGTDIFGDSDDDDVPTIFDNTENFSLAEPSNHTLSWTLEIPADSCVLMIEFSLYLKETGQEIDSELHDLSETRYIPICDWPQDIDVDDGEGTVESMLKLDENGLVLTIDEIWSSEWLLYIDYNFGDRDQIDNQSEFDIFADKSGWEAMGEDSEECIDRDIVIGSSWMLNGEAVESDFSYCEWTFDENGFQTTAHFFVNGSWEADANGQWELGIFTGTFYDNCTVDDTSTSSDGSEGVWSCVSDEFVTHYFGSWDTDRECVENTDTNKWHCDGYEFGDEDEIYDHCDLIYWSEYEGGPTYTDYSCVNYDQFVNHTYEITECNMNSDLYYCKSIEVVEVYWRTMMFCNWDATSESNDCSDAANNYEQEWYDYCEWDENEELWYCTNYFGQSTSFANTAGNTHHLDDNSPSGMFVQSVRYGVSSSDDFRLMSSKFVFDDESEMMVNVSSNSTYSDIAHDWNGISNGIFVWTLPGEVIDNSTTGNTTNNTVNNSTDGNNTGNNTQNTSNNSTDGNNTGNSTDNSTDGTNIGNNTDNSTDVIDTGNPTNNSTIDTTPEPPSIESSDAPGFTASLSMIALVGAVLIFGRHRKND